MYFSDNVEGRTPNTYAFVPSSDNGGDLTFYYVFQHSASTNNVVMSILFILSIQGMVYLFLLIKAK